MKVEDFLHRLTYSQALILTMSEMSLMLYADPAQTNEVLASDLEIDDRVARTEFGRLENKLQHLAIQWCSGKLGAGAEWDNRRKA